MINTALKPLYSRVFSYRERIYRYFLQILITQCIFFIPRQHSRRCFTVLIKNIVYRLGSSFFVGGSALNDLV